MVVERARVQEELFAGLADRTTTPFGFVAGAAVALTMIVIEADASQDVRLF